MEKGEENWRPTLPREIASPIPFMNRNFSARELPILKIARAGESMF
jgi:hypothetical protein